MVGIDDHHVEAADSPEHFRTTPWFDLEQFLEGSLAKSSTRPLGVQPNVQVVRGVVAGVSRLAAWYVQVFHNTRQGYPRVQFFFGLLGGRFYGETQQGPFHLRWPSPLVSFHHHMGFNVRIRRLSTAEQLPDRAVQADLPFNPREGMLDRLTLQKSFGLPLRGESPEIIADAPNHALL